MRNTHLRSALLVIGLMSLVGCNEDTERTPQSDQPTACSGAIVKGTWTGDILGNVDTLTFNEDCSGSSSYCATQFNYPMVSANSGTATISVTATNNNQGCLPMGDASCGYTVSGDTLSFDCGGSVLVYTRQ
jgi:hypothetical protein